MKGTVEMELNRRTFKWAERIAKRLESGTNNKLPKSPTKVEQRKK